MDARALRLGSLCLAAPLAGALAGAPTLDNTLSTCLAAHLAPPRTAQGQVLLPLTLEARRSTGECGCTSALIRYRLLATGAGATSFILQEGLLDSRHAGARTLMLVADARLAAGREIEVTLGCRAPD
ncbi:DUF2195 family protein [Pseudomonas guariconensis]|uniref:DUF2195 family protein n=1 Tax=Pseudomonas TaxID=286 RepID=UPI001CE3FDCC|nr:MULTISPECIES: DUF2195 family protein [Pseudomonas]MCO7637640.1 DUF2195 family protein [Pseudomonas sp. S 311-6]MCO7517348.1 DUF2195 family protein [Pseudomonas putida]MCO7564949.1 DUF2195 family protein [Pseudomonas mosselii]MCO7594943.1 DUF2195 family protein [Pseudomonas guariconensis]MCO7604377.1 DUF2195 family protein [Pseudomonas guariconensis]